MTCSAMSAARLRLSATLLERGSGALRAGDRRDHRSQGRAVHHRRRRGAGIRGYSHRLGGRPVGAADAADAAGYAYNSSAYGSADRRKPWMDQDRIGWLNFIARVDRATQAEATTLLQNANARGLQRMADTFSDPRERSSTVARTLVVTRSLGVLRTPARFSDALLALGALVAVVLLVTCANISNLLLARAPDAAARPAFAFRWGHDRTSGQAASCRESRAGRGRRRNERPRRVLDEHVPGAIRLRRTGEFPPVFTLDARVWIFTAVLSIGCALAFGLAPALRAVAAGQTSGIHDQPARQCLQRDEGHASSRGRSTPPCRSRWSLPLYFLGARCRTSPARSRFQPGSSHHCGDRSGHQRVRAEQIPVMVDRLVAAIDAVPGVVSTSVTTCGLMTNCSYSSGFTIEGADRGIQLNNNWVSPRISQPSAFPSWPAAIHRARHGTEPARRDHQRIDRAPVFHESEPAR